MTAAEGTAWNEGAEANRVPPRECVRAARDALSKAYGYSEPPWPLIAEAVDWLRRAAEQMIPEDTP